MKAREEDLDRILGILRDHPWSSAWHLAELSQLPIRTVYRHLDEMARRGWIWSLQVGMPDVKGRIYAPGREGLIHLAGGRDLAWPYAQRMGLDPLSLGKSLMRVRALTWARNWLVSVLQRGGHLVWAVSPARIPVGSRVLFLDMFGVISPWPGLYVTFGMIADTGGVSVKGWGERLGLFLTWAGGIYASERSDCPLLLVLTPWDRRARQWVRLWGAVIARRRQAMEKVYERPSRPGGRQVRPEALELRRRMTGLPLENLVDFRVISLDRLGAGGAWLTPYGPRYLWEALHGSNRPFPREYREGGPAPSSRGDGLGGCMLPRSLGGSLALQSFLRMNEQDWRVMEAVASWPLLRGGELAVFLGMQTGRVAQVLRHLDGMGLVQRDSDRRWSLSPLGIQIMAAVSGMRVRQFGRARHWPVGRSGEVRLHLGAYRYASRHTDLVVKFVMGLRQWAIWWQKMGYLCHLVIWDSVESQHEYVDVEGNIRFLRPDSEGEIRIGNRNLYFFLEVDRDRGHEERLREKFSHYYEYRRSPGVLESGMMPRLLVVCSTEGRARQINGVLLDLARERGEPVLDAMIAPLDRLWFTGIRDDIDGTVRPERKERGKGRSPSPSIWPDAPEWRPAGEGFSTSVPTWCFPEMAPGWIQREAMLPPGIQEEKLRRREALSRAQRRRRSCSR